MHHRCCALSSVSRSVCLSKVLGVSCQDCVFSDCLTYLTKLSQSGLKAGSTWSKHTLDMQLGRDVLTAPLIIYYT